MAKNNKRTTKNQRQQARRRDRERERQPKPPKPKRGRDDPDAIVLRPLYGEQLDRATPREGAELLGSTADTTLHLKHAMMLAGFLAERLLEPLNRIADRLDALAPHDPIELNEPEDDDETDDDEDDDDNDDAGA